MINSKILSSAVIAAFLSVGAVHAESNAMEQVGKKAERTKNKVTKDAKQMTGSGDFATATISDIKDNPEKYVGKRVRVEGSVDEVYGNRSLKVENDKFFDDELLVIAKKPLNELTGDKVSLTEDAQVEVAGTVRQYRQVEIERETGWDLDPQIEMEFEGIKTALILDEIRPVARQAAGEIKE